MPVSRTKWASVLCCVAAVSCVQRAPSTDVPSAEAAPLPAAVHGAARRHRAEVEALVKPLIDGRWLSGLWIGLISERGRESYAWGAVNEGGSLPDERTIWEIGSVTKTFNALLLAEHTLEGQLELEAPVQTLLPRDRVRVPTWDGSAITLLHLVTHTSGLPPLPTNFETAPDYDPNDPYTNYTEALLYDFLNGYALTRAPGAAWQYSNLGAGLLGHALALELQRPWIAAVTADVIQPLGLTDTGVVLSADQRARFAQPHDADLRPVPEWKFDVLASAGSLRSSGLDMLKYAALHAGLWRSRQLAEAVELTHQPRFDASSAIGLPNTQIGLAWLIENEQFIWHNGGTGGTSSFIGADPTRRAVVVVFANTASEAYQPVTQLGRALQRLMAGEQPAALSLPPAETPLPESTLDAYTGEFAFTLQDTPQTLSVVRRGEQLYARALGVEARLYAISETRFYTRVLPVTLSFAPGATRELDTWAVAGADLDVTATRR